MEGLAITIGVLLVIVTIVLPIVAIVRTGRIRNLETRIAGLEAALLRLMREHEGVAPAAPVQQPETVVAPAPPAPVPVPVPVPVTAPPPPSESLESVIGQRWIGWIAIILIFVAAAFFLKYAFENRWIGELGRVAFGVMAGLAFVWGGLDRHRKGWRYLAQVLTAGGVTILYLSVFGAFGYYHLVDQRTAFLFLAVVVAEAHLLALQYDAPSIAIMALVGGFLTPILLSTGRDRYGVLFTYIVLLDSGTLFVIMRRRWRWLATLAYALTQLMFAAWYQEHYHPAKRPAVTLFQLAVFALFTLAALAPRIRGELSGLEEWVRLGVNPFVLYGVCYLIWDDDYHNWMAPAALVLAIVYVALARWELAQRLLDRRLLVVAVATALTFVTLAIPVQLESNWITLAWAMEAVALVWASFETLAPRLRALSWVVFGLAVVRYLVLDTPWEYRAEFTPVFNRFFLGTLALAACFGAAAYLMQHVGRAGLLAGLIGAGVLWFGSTVEAYTYFDALARAEMQRPSADSAAVVRHLRWAGQLTLTVLWTSFAGALTALGFRRQVGALRVAGLVLFGITLVKVVFFDIAELQQFYRILALLALGLVLMAVAWAYQRAMRRERAS